MAHAHAGELADCDERRFDFGRGTRLNTAQAFVNYRLNAAIELGGGYNYTKGSGNNVDASYNQVSLGANYSLSTRTDLLALAGLSKGLQQHN